MNLIPERDAAYRAAYRAYHAYPVTRAAYNAYWAVYDATYRALTREHKQLPV